MRRFLLFCSFLIFTFNLSATRWRAVNRTCPICSHEAEYEQISSYGGYIYHWPSKFQYVYWPLTDFPSVYSCTECHFTTYMWDFDSVPDIKKDAIKSYLATIKLDRKYDSYLSIPMSIRFDIAQGIYTVLERDVEFWCDFNRVAGYHYERENQPEKARDSRLASLELANQILRDSLCRGREKEYYIIKAAMYNFTDQKDNAVVHLNKASQFTYHNEKWKEERNKEYDSYLTNLIHQYRDFMEKE